jgi:hypothetical protein
MLTLDVLAPETIAAHLAPVIDRLRLAAARRTMQLSTSAGLITAAGVDRPAFQLFMMMRNTFPDRTVTVEQVAAPFTYQRPDAAAVLIAELVQAGHLQEQPGSTLRLSAAGADLMGRLLAVGAQAVAELWCTDETSASPLLPLVDQALMAAAPSGGLGFALMTPTYDAPGASAEVRLSERLAGLRFHRFDAHVRAWTSAGLTPEAVKALKPGPERDAIENETNLLAGAAYETLNQRERLELLARLGALPG